MRKQWLPDDQIKEAITTLLYKGEKDLGLYLDGCDLSKSKKSKVKRALLEAKGEDYFKIINSLITLSDLYNQYLLERKSNIQECYNSGLLIESIEALVNELELIKDNSFIAEKNIYFQMDSLCLSWLSFVWVL